MTIEKADFWQEWRAVIIFFSVFLLLLVAISFWARRQYHQPIDVVYQDYLGQLAAASPAAKRYADNYFRHTQRDSVASQDFLMVCSGMVYQAKQESIDVNRFNKNLTTLCENSAVYINHDLLSR